MTKISRLRLDQLERADELRQDLFLLRRALALAPAAENAINARIAELLAERERLDPPMDYCVACGFEWDGREEPPQEQGPECCHEDMFRIWDETCECGIRRGSTEPLDKFIDRAVATFFAT
jgi:hypothetical protein